MADEQVEDLDELDDFDDDFDVWDDDPAPPVDDKEEHKGAKEEEKEEEKDDDEEEAGVEEVPDEEEEKEEEEEEEDKEKPKEEEEDKEKPEAKIEVEVDGEKSEVTIEELKKGYQLAASSTKRFTQASQMRNQSLEIAKLFKENPRLALEKCGHDVLEFAIKVVEEQINYESMSDEEKKVVNAKKELEKVQELQRQAEQQEQTRVETTLREEIKQDIIDTFDQYAKIPLNTYTYNLTVAALQHAEAFRKENSPEDPMFKTKDVLAYVEKQYQDSISRIPKDHLKKFVEEEEPKTKEKKKDKKLVSKEVKKKVVKDKNEGSRGKHKEQRSQEDFFDALKKKDRLNAR